MDGLCVSDVIITYLVVVADVLAFGHLTWPRPNGAMVDSELGGVR